VLSARVGRRELLDRQDLGDDWSKPPASTSRASSIKPCRSGSTSLKPVRITRATAVAWTLALGFHGPETESSVQRASPQPRKNDRHDRVTSDGRGSRFVAAWGAGCRLPLRAGAKRKEHYARCRATCAKDCGSVAGRQATGAVFLVGADLRFDLVGEIKRQGVSMRSCAVAVSGWPDGSPVRTAPGLLVVCASSRCAGGRRAATIEVRLAVGLVPAEGLGFAGETVASRAGRGALPLRARRWRAHQRAAAPRYPTRELRPGR
jgi:hypothetical protein